MSTWTSIRNGVEKILPYAAGAINPALGAVLATALGTSPTPDAVGAALASDPQAQEKVLQYEVQIKQIVANQAVADHQADVALQQSDAADRASARQLAEQRGFTPQVVITALLFIMLAGTLGCLVFDLAKVNPDWKETVHDLVTAMTNGFLLILNFWFGSTHGSQKKDAALAQAANAP